MCNSRNRKRRQLLYHTNLRQPQHTPLKPMHPQRRHKPRPKLRRMPCRPHRTKRRLLSNRQHPPHRNNKLQRHRRISPNKQQHINRRLPRTSRNQRRQPQDRTPPLHKGSNTKHNLSNQPHHELLTIYQKRRPRLINKPHIPPNRLKEKARRTRRKLRWNYPLHLSLNRKQEKVEVGQPRLPSRWLQPFFIVKRLRQKGGATHERRSTPADYNLDLGRLGMSLFEDQSRP